MPDSLLRDAIEQSGLSLREVGRRAGTSHATLSAYLHGKKSPTLTTAMRIIRACNLDVSWTFNKRIRFNNGLSRDEELQQVLRLAAAFPASPPQAPNYPIFPPGQTDGSNR